MLSLPKKPNIKKAKITLDGEGVYTLQFTSPIKSEDEFNEMIKEDISACLEPDGSLVDSSWETRTIAVRLENFRSFQQCLSRRFYFLMRMF